MFEIHADAGEADFGLVDGLRDRGARAEQPTAGMSPDQQLAFDASAAASAGQSSAAAGPAPRWQERDAWTAIADLDETPVLVRARDWPADLACLDRPGLHAWWVDDAGAADLAGGLGLALEPGRIYAGQAGATRWPSGRSGDDTLGRRIGETQLGGKVRMSSFRWTLAAILFTQLDVQVQGAMLITPPSERALTEWMREHLSIAVHAHDDRDTLEGLEREFLRTFDPPLNVRHMPATTLRARVIDVRRRISREQ